MMTKLIQLGSDDKCRGVMNKLAAALEGQGGGADWPGIGYVRIDGASDSRDRRAAVAQFRDDPNIAVALLSVTAAGEQLLACFCRAAVAGWLEWYARL